MLKYWRWIINLQWIKTSCFPLYNTLNWLLNLITRQSFGGNDAFQTVLLYKKSCQKLFLCTCEILGASFGCFNVPICRSARTCLTFTVLQKHCTEPADVALHKYTCPLHEHHISKLPSCPGLDCLPKGYNINMARWGKYLSPGCFSHPPPPHFSWASFPFSVIFMICVLCVCVYTCAYVCVS